MSNPDALSLDSYVIKRPQKFSFSVSYDCLDAQGNKLFDIKRSVLGSEYTFIDDTGKAVGIVHQKALSITPSFQLMDGTKKLLGMVIAKLQILGGLEHHYILEDEKGSTIALATGDYTNFNYVLAGPDGKSQIAEITREAQGVDDSVARLLMNSAFGAFMINITDKGFSRLIVLQFVVAIDMLSNMNSRSGMGAGLMGGTPLGGGGPYIKL